MTVYAAYDFLSGVPNKNINTHTHTFLTDYKNKQKWNIKLQIRKHVQQVRRHLPILFGLQNRETNYLHNATQDYGKLNYK